MLSDARLRRLAAAGATLGAAGVALAALEVAALPEPRGDGLPTAFGAAFALLLFANSLATLAASGLLAAAVSRWSPGPWSRRLLAVGVAAAGLAILVRSVGTVEFVTDAEVALPWVRAWTLFAVVGVACAALGLLATAVEPVGRARGGALVGGLCLLLVAGAAAGELGRLHWLLLLLAAYCVNLGAALHVVGPLDRTPVRAALATLVLLGSAATAHGLLTAGAGAATPAALAALVTLWALAATSQS